MNIEHPVKDGFGCWRKSSFSEPNGNQCVEVAYSEVAVGLRDSKAPAGPKLTFEHSRWLAFTTAVAKSDA
jgi:hypothetical protein